MNTTQYTVCIVGDKNGKTTLIEQFSSGDLTKMPKDNVLEVRNKVVQREKDEINWELWSSSSQNQLTSLLKLAYKRADVFLLTFSINNRASFDMLDDLYKFIKMKMTRVVPFVLVGCKCDLEYERVVSKLDAFDFSINHQIEYIEVSGLKNINVTELFDLILKKLEEKEGSNTKEEEPIRKSIKFIKAPNENDDSIRKSIMLNKALTESKKKRADCSQ